MYVNEKEFIEDQLRLFSPDSIKLWNDELEENITINFCINQPSWRRLYEKLTYEFTKVESGLYVYPFERLHMTLLGRVDKKLGAEKIGRVVRDSMVGEKFLFDIGYLANNNMGVSIIAEPRFDLGGLRNKIREDLGVRGDDYTKYSNIYERLAWINFLRFKEKPDNAFFDILWELREYQFGEYEAKDINVFLNRSRTLDLEKCSLIERIVF